MQYFFFFLFLHIHSAQKLIALRGTRRPRYNLRLLENTGEPILILRIEENSRCNVRNNAVIRLNMYLRQFNSINLDVETGPRIYRAPLTLSSGLLRHNRQRRPFCPRRHYVNASIEFLDIHARLAATFRKRIKTSRAVSTLVRNLTFCWNELLIARVHFKSIFFDGCPSGVGLGQLSDRIQIQIK